MRPELPLQALQAASDGQLKGKLVFVFGASQKAWILTDYLHVDRATATTLLTDNTLSSIYDHEDRYFIFLPYPKYVKAWMRDAGRASMVNNLIEAYIRFPDILKSENMPWDFSVFGSFTKQTAQQGFICEESTQVEESIPPAQAPEMQQSYEWIAPRIPQARINELTQLEGDVDLTDLKPLTKTVVDRCKAQAMMDTFRYQEPGETKHDAQHMARRKALFDRYTTIRLPIPEPDAPDYEATTLRRKRHDGRAAYPGESEASRAERREKIRSAWSTKTIAKADDANPNELESATSRRDGRLASAGIDNTTRGQIDTLIRSDGFTSSFASWYIGTYKIHQASTGIAPRHWAMYFGLLSGADSTAIFLYKEESDAAREMKAKMVRHKPLVVEVLEAIKKKIVVPDDTDEDDDDCLIVGSLSTVAPAARKRVKTTTVPY